MSETPREEPTIIRTSRGLSIAGTRITLYAIMDYLRADWPASLVQDWFNLTDQQMTDVLTYVEQHREAVETEYQQVLQYAQQNRQYWETVTQTRQQTQDVSPVAPEQAALRAKLAAWKAQIPPT